MQKKLSKDYIQQVQKELATDAKEEPKQEAIEPSAPVAVASSSSSEPSLRKRKTRKSKLSEWQSYPAFGIRPNPADFDCLIPLKPFDVDLLALIFYCERAMPDSACSFSIDTIAQKNNISKDMVRDSIKRLYKNGLILQTKRVKKSTLLTLSEKTRLQMVQLSSRNFRHDNNLSSGKNLQDNSLSNRKFSQDNDLSSRKFPQDNDLSSRKNLQDKDLSSGKNLQDKNYLVGNSNKISAYLVGNSDPIKNIYNTTTTTREEDVVVDDVNKEDNSIFDEKLKNLIELWEKGTGMAITPFQAESLHSLIEDFSYEYVYHGLIYTFKHTTRSALPYVTRVLESWKQHKGIGKPWEREYHSFSQTSQFQEEKDTMTQEQFEEYERQAQARAES